MSTDGRAFRAEGRNEAQRDDGVKSLSDGRVVCAEGIIEHQTCKRKEEIQDQVAMYH